MFRFQIVIVISIGLLCGAEAQQPAGAVSQPILRLRPDGTHASISEMFFSSDGKTLFAAGDGKQVDAWTFQDGAMRRNHALTFRHPIGPGPTGTIRAMAKSDDDRFLVVGGIGAITRGADFRTNGIMIPAFGFDEVTLRELGTVTVLDHDKKTQRAVETHLGYVLSMACVSRGPKQPTMLLTVGNDEQSGQCVDKPAPASEVRRSLRVFNVDTGDLISDFDFPTSGFEPRLKAWAEQGPMKDSVRVAVTSADGVKGGLVIHTVSENSILKIDEPFAIDVTQPDANGILYFPGRRAINTFDTNRDQTGPVIELSNSLKQSEFIFRVTLLERVADTVPPILAVVSRDLANPTLGHELRLIDTVSGRVLSPTISLGSRQNPVVAYSPVSGLLAATADPTVGLMIFDIARLLRGNGQPILQLRPDFVPILRAALVRGKDQQTGLRFEHVNLSRHTRRIELIGGRLRSVGRTPWRSFNSKVSFIRSGDGKRLTPVTVVSGQSRRLDPIETNVDAIGASATLKFLGDLPVTAIGYLPSSSETRSRLVLMDSRTGETLRVFNGHDQTISSIEFSKSGKRLTTVSVDGMVCVWALDDLADLVGKRGMLRDVKLCFDDESVVVASVEPGNNHGLIPGDRIVELVKRSKDKNKSPVIYKSVADLLIEISLLPAGSNVILRVRRAGATFSHAVQLGQATDERKPLFSVVFSANKEQDRLSWLAWSPHGPFESSDRAMELSAGWHFNRPQADSLIRFAPLAEYRNRFFGSGLIDSLLSKGHVPDQWPPTVLPDLSGTISNDQGDEILANGRSFSLPGGQLRSLRFLVDGIPPAEVASVLLRLDNREVIPLYPLVTDPEIWEAEPNLSLAEGETHVAEVIISSDRIKDRTYADLWRINVPRLVARRKISNPKQANNEPAKNDVLGKPVLPNVKIVSHQNRNILVTPANFNGDLSLELKAKVDCESVHPNWKYFIDVRGKLQPLADTHVTGSQIQGTFHLPIGKHLVAFVIRSGERISRSGTIVIDRRDPPEIESFSAQLGDGSYGSAVALIRSTNPIEQDQLKVHVEGIGFDDLTTEIFPVRGRLDRYEARISDIPLVEGENRLELTVVDNYGHRRPSASAFVYHRPHQDPPDLLVSLERATAIEEASFEFGFRITSQRSTHVRVVLNQKKILPRLVEQTAEGTSTYRQFVTLKEGSNRIVVSTSAEDGQTVHSIHHVFRVSEPIRVEVNQIVDSLGKPIEFATSSDGLCAASASPTSQVMLRGRVQLGQADAKKNRVSVRGWVNGFLQSVVALRSGNNGEYVFELPVTLTSQHCSIRIDLPGLPEAESSDTKLQIQCDAPSTDQTLHLIVISTEVEEGQRTEFEQQVMQAFHVSNGKAPAFKKVLGGGAIYPALTGGVRSDSIRALLRRCRVRTRGSNGHSNVVLFYFHGQEIRGELGNFGLVTEDVLERLLDDPSVISSDYLGERFRQMRGAHLVFMDVSAHPLSHAVATAGDPRHPDLGVLRLQRDNNAKNQTSSLLKQLEVTLPEVERLVDLVERMKSAQQHTPLVFQDTIPQDLKNLRISLR